MNGYANGHRTYAVNQEPDESYSELLHMEVEPDFESHKMYPKSRLANNKIGPKILNFSLNQNKHQFKQSVKQEPEFIFDEDSGTILHYYTESLTSTTHQVEVKKEAVVKPTQRVQIKFEDDTPKQRLAVPKMLVATQNAVKPAWQPPAFKPQSLQPYKPPAPEISAPKPPPAVVHPEPEFPVQLSVNRKLYKCPTCSDQFLRSYQLKRHHFLAHTTAGKANPSVPVTPNQTPKMAITHVRETPVQVPQMHQIPVHSPALPSDKPIIRLFKSPIFTNGSIPIRVLPRHSVQSPGPQMISPSASERSTLVPTNTPNKLNNTTISRIPWTPDGATQDKPNLFMSDNSLTITPRPGSFRSNYNSSVAPPYVSSPSNIVPSTMISMTGPAPKNSPRIVVRKDHPNAVKFTESTQNEWTQITYEIPLDGSDICFKCATCDKSFGHLPDLDQHLQCHNGQPFRYKCELCDDYVLSIAHLRNHVHSHTRSHLPIKCDRCERRFIDEPAVYRHECLQPNAAVCLPCRQSFLSSGLLKSHEFMHTRVKPYKCELCDELFIHMSALTKHQECKQSCVALNRTKI